MGARSCFTQCKSPEQAPLSFCPSPPPQVYPLQQGRLQGRTVSALTKQLPAGRATDLEAPCGYRTLHTPWTPWPQGRGRGRKAQPPAATTPRNVKPVRRPHGFPGADPIPTCLGTPAYFRFCGQHTPSQDLAFAGSAAIPTWGRGPDEPTPRQIWGFYRTWSKTI